MMSNSVGGGGMLTTGARLSHMERLYSGHHPNPSFSPPEYYMDSQPLDFSTKKGKRSHSMSASDHSDSGRGSPTEDHPGAFMGLALRLQASEAGLSVGSRSPEDGSPHRLTSTSPMAHSPIKPSHHNYGAMAHAPLNLAMPSAVSAALLAQLHSNPLLFSTLRSALANPNMASAPHLPPYFPQSSLSPPAADFSMSSPEPLHTPTIPQYPASTRNLGIGAAEVESSRGSIDLGNASLSGVGLTHHQSSLSPHGLSSMEGLTSGVIAAGSGILNGPHGEMIVNERSNDEYRLFRDKMLAQVSAAKSRRTNARKPTVGKSVHTIPSSPKAEDLLNDNDNISVDDDNSDKAGAVDSQSGGKDEKEAEALIEGLSSGVGSVRRRGRHDSGSVKDDAYWERRRKNNEAAKRSRDLRRAKEDEVAIRAAFLEQENIKLNVEVTSLKTQTARLRCMLYNS